VTPHMPITEVDAEQIAVRRSVHEHMFAALSDGNV
jgi:hypothetical protein